MAQTKCVNCHDEAWKNAQPAAPERPTVAGQDCATAERLCSWPGVAGFTVPTSSGGFGTQELVYGTNTDCIGGGGERQSSWYVFTVTQSGSLAFTITPTAPVDYDWAVWDITNGGCESKSIANQVACNYSGCTAGNASTGMSDAPCTQGATLCYGTCPIPVSAFSTQEAWRASAPLTAGRTYALLVNCFTPNATAGFNFRFTGTAQIGVPAPSFSVAYTGCRSITATPMVAIPGATYSWSWGDGSTSTGSSGPAPHTYAGTGSSYQVTLQVLVPGCAPVSTTQTINLPPPPAAPTFTVQADCSGLVTATLTSPVEPLVTYVWSWGDNTGTLTGPGPYTHQYAADGTYPVTITATNSVGCTVTTSQPVTIALGACCPRNVPAANRLGEPGQLTTLTGGAFYSGTYWVRGDLLLTDGTYTLQVGTVFYVDGEATRLPTASGVDDRDVRGCRITLGDKARLVLNGATITASGNTPNCPMWRGIVVEGSLPTGTLPPTTSPDDVAQVVMRNGSFISHAYCALTITDHSTTSNGIAYSLTDSYFRHNLTHVLDMGIRKRGFGPGVPGGAAIVRNCTFDADPALMRFPYNATSATASDQYVTYQALQLLPFNDPNSDADAVQVTGNTIGHAIYGIVNNLPGSLETHDVLIKDNYLSDIYQTGIWAVDNQALPQPGTGASVGEVSGNVVLLSDWGGQVTEQLAAVNLRIGLSNESSQGGGNPDAAFRNNQVYGQVGGTRPQLGLNLRDQVAASGNTLTNLREGIRTAALSQGRVYGNEVTDCDDGVSVQPSGSYGYDAQIGCNTFQRDQAGGLLRGINVVQNADFNDQGEPGAPAGNKFLGIDEKVRNDGNNSIRYWQTSSTDEDVISIGGLASGTVITDFSVSPVDYCRATAPNGINARGTAPSPGYLAALADTVRRQLVPRPRRRAYLNELLRYYLAQEQAADLEAWWATLLPGNVEDYRTTGLSLLRAYDQQAATAADAQRVLTALQPQAQLNADLAAELALREVERHLPQTAPRLTAADSTALQTLTWSGTVAAGRAGRWLRYFHPRVPLPTANPDPWRTAARPVAASPVKSALAAHLGEAYPNPARTEVQIACQLPAGTVGGTLCFTDLVTGRTVREVSVSGSEQAKPVQVSLSEMAAGPYACRLLVDGRPVTGARKLVVLP